MFLIVGHSPDQVCICFMQQVRNVSAHSYNPSAHIFFQNSIRFSYYSLVRNPPQAGVAHRQGIEDTGRNNSTEHNVQLLGKNTLPFQAFQQVTTL